MYTFLLSYTFISVVMVLVIYIRVIEFIFQFKNNIRSANLSHMAEIVSLKNAWLGSLVFVPMFPLTISTRSCFCFAFIQVFVLKSLESHVIKFIKSLSNY